MDATFWIELIGWLASALTIATYAMNTMIPLRVLALGSSLLFIFYAATLQLWPLLVMEAILLPINIYRLWQILSLRGRLLAVSEGVEPDFSIVTRYGQKLHLAKDATIFNRGDAVDQFYYIADGQVLIEEPNAVLSSGDVFGEIAFFTVGAKRTATARCTEDAVVYALDKKGFMRLQFEDPSFGMAIMQIVTTRLIANGQN
ncbi:MAG: cyclic nucleotide-binding domain-containing protein [Pseudomonadota bacterium]